MTTTTSTSRDITGSMTQVFTVQCPNGVSSAFLSKIDLFFGAKSTSFGAELSIVELNNGLPDISRVVPGSVVTLTTDDIQVSNNGSVATSFRFSRPVQLNAGQSYAFTLRALGNSPDYSVWTAVNGDIDLATGKSVSPNPLSGACYYAKNSTTWSKIANEQIKFSIWRASFNVGSPSTAFLKTSNNEILGITDIVFASGMPDVRAGDEVYGLYQGIANSTYYAQVVGFDTTNNYLYLKNSTGNFKLNMPITIVRAAKEKDLTNAGMMAIGMINDVIDYPLHAVVPKIGLINAPQTTSSISYRGTYKAGTPAIAVKESTNWITLTNENETEFHDKARYILSRSNEVADLSSNSSLDLKVTLTSSSDYVSPMVDLKSRSVIAIQNLINSEIDGEEGAYGNALTRYISKIVTLADGQDAEDMQVWIDAYKPPGTQVRVYCKLWNAQDPDSFDSKPWTLMTQTTDPNLYSARNDFSDFKEYAFAMPTVSPTVTGAAWSPQVNDPVDGDPVQYSTSNGTFVGFKKFSVKVVLSVDVDDEAYNYPVLNDIRAIALQK